MISEGDLYDLEVEDLGYGAKGLARLSSFVIWIQGAIPGDLVRVKIKKRKPKFAEAEVMEILEPSPYRVKPRSPDCSSCGGCQLIHMKYENQLYYKAKQLNDILRRIGKVKDFVQKEIVPSPKIFRYRNKMQFSFGRDGSDQIILGLHHQNSHERVLNIKSCHLQSIRANDILKFTKEYFASLSPRYAREEPIPFQHISIREGKNTGDFLVALEAREEVFDEVSRFSEKIRASFPEVKSFVFSAEDNSAAWKRKSHFRILYGDGTIEEKVGSLRFKICSDSFFQSNTEQAENLLAAIRDLISSDSVLSLLDLYCGSGSISLSLSEKSKEILGIDHSEASIQSAVQNRDINNISNCHFLCMDAAEATKKFLQLDNQYDLITANPPRTGIPPKVIFNISQLSPKSVIYISCNPATLARDCQQFQSLGFELKEIRPIDMFPHTFHIETIAHLQRNG